VPRGVFPSLIKRDPPELLCLVDVGYGPDDGRRFTEIYNVDKLTGAGMLGSSKVVVSTIQRVFKALSGGQVTDQDDPNLDDFVPGR